MSIGGDAGGRTTQGTVGRTTTRREPGHGKGKRVRRVPRLLPSLLAVAQLPAAALCEHALHSTVSRAAPPRWDGFSLVLGGVGGYSLCGNARERTVEAGSGTLSPPRAPADSARGPCGGPIPILCPIKYGSSALH